MLRGVQICLHFRLRWPESSGRRAAVGGDGRGLRRRFGGFPATFSKNKLVGFVQESVF